MSENTETAILAGGCTWVTQELMRAYREGVISIRAGWTGGESENPTEENPGGHAEAVEIVFERDRVSYREILELFFQIHRPDLDERTVGSLYRSEVFCTNDEQRQIAEETIADFDAARFWPGKLATRVSEAGPFLEDEAEDQDFLQRYPDSSRAPQPGLAAASHESAA